MHKDHYCICGNQIPYTAKSEYTVVTRWGRVQIHRCKLCGLAQAVTFPSAEECKELYESQKIYNPPDNTEFEKISRYFYHIINDLRQIGITSGSLLEIGCHSGYALTILRKAGFNVCGIEPNVACSEYARTQYNLTVYKDFSYLPKDTKFDVVFASHVLEHIPDLHMFLSQLCGLVKSKGILYVKVPNYGSLYDRYVAKGRCGNIIPKQHLWYFEKQSLTKSLVRYGFTLLDAHTRIFTFSQSPFLVKRFAASLLGKIERLLDQGQEIVGIYRYG